MEPQDRPLNMLLKRLAARLYDTAHAISLKEAEAMYHDADTIPEPMTEAEVERIVQRVIEKDQ